MDFLTSMFGTGGVATVAKAGGAALTLLLVVPALLKMFIVTVDEGNAALRTRNGKPIIRKASPRFRKADRNSDDEVVVLRPGSHGAFPIFYWYKLVDVRWRALDLPPRQLTDAAGHQHLVHASFEWRPIVSGRDLRVFELDVVNVAERTANIVGAALRDAIRLQDRATLPGNDVIGPQVVAACLEQARDVCGVEITGVRITGDALTDGFLLSQAIRNSTYDPAPAIAALHAVG